MRKLLALFLIAVGTAAIYFVCFATEAPVLPKSENLIILFKVLFSIITIVGLLGIYFATGETTIKQSNTFIIIVGFLLLCMIITCLHILNV